MSALTLESLEALRTEVKAWRMPDLDTARAEAIHAALAGVSSPVEALEVLVTHGFLPQDWTDLDAGRRRFYHPTNALFRARGRVTIQNGECSLLIGPRSLGGAITASALAALASIGVTVSELRDAAGKQFFTREEERLLTFPVSALDPDVFGPKCDPQHIAYKELTLRNGRMCLAREACDETHPVSVEQVATLAYHADAVVTAETLLRELYAVTDEDAVPVWRVQNDSRRTFHREGSWKYRVLIDGVEIRGALVDPSTDGSGARSLRASGVVQSMGSEIVENALNGVELEGGVDGSTGEDLTYLQTNISRALGVPQQYLSGEGSNLSAEPWMRQLLEETQRTPTIRRVFPPGLIATELVSIQPMSVPSGAIFYRDFQYGTMKAWAYNHYDIQRVATLLRRETAPEASELEKEHTDYLAPWLVALWRTAVTHPAEHTLSLDGRGFPWSK